MEPAAVGLAQALPDEDSYAPSSNMPTPTTPAMTNGSRSRKPSLTAPAGLASWKAASGVDASKSMVLELEDGTAYQGVSFGAPSKSVSGECVFQTGMVGYPESLTDPSYEGQILILTYPLIGSYGVPARVKPSSPTDLPLEFESNRIHVAALVVASYSGEGQDFSHHLADSELGQWLKEEGIPAICGIDTRAVTKRIREGGVLLAKVLAAIPEGERGRSLQVGQPRPRSWVADYIDVPLHDPNAENLVAKVSCKLATVYHPKTPLLHPSGRTMRILSIDVGMKYNQIRCFINRGVELKVVPWNYDFTAATEEPFDGLFISNGPGDPITVEQTIKRIRVMIDRKSVPIFGICLGHQLLALAAGAKTTKLKYGNRGANIPCTNLINGRCYITSQNHGYAADASSLPEGWKELFVNANDGTNEGIYSTVDPYFSVQFHPESTPGPRDTEFLFDVFINNALQCAKAGKFVSILMPGGTIPDNIAKYPKVTCRKVLVLGSGGLSIGQAGEFDYSGSQAIKALKEEGIYTILINPNIATIQTSAGLADKVFFLPVTPEFVTKVIEHERPDGIYVTFGGQTALGVGIKLKDDFERLGVRVLGTPIETIITTEDRELFARAMEQIGEHCAKSASAVTTEEALAAAKDIGYPVICRAAFALGGLGSGFANTDSELTELCNKAFATSPQVLIERSMKGWKEIEYEVVRDCRDNCITVCNMENFDPLGIHTGDSIVVAPSQTLSDADYNMLRTTAVNVIRHLGVIGECNIQYALNPFSKEYRIIEVNARLSRSSALASKATGYPLAFVAAKLGLGMPLNEIKNSVTKSTSACFEPSLDYVVVKIPRWDLRKFSRVSTSLGSSMKSVGEVMAIGRNFEETIQKAIRAIDPQFYGFGKNDFIAESDEDLQYELSHPSDKRIFAIANCFARGYTVDQIWEYTRIDKWFLRKLEHISMLEKRISEHHNSPAPAQLLFSAKQMGFSDRHLAKLLGSNELAVRKQRQEQGIYPFVKQIDTVAAEFPCFTNYLYTTYNAIENDVTFEDRGTMVLGSGVYRIGSSVEFDWCAVRAIRTLRQRGYKTIMINYNPETVSTDYDEADRLYFETITLETVLDIYELERSGGVIISVGGQTPNNIALPLYRQNVKILGTSPEMIDTAENRYKFSRMLDRIGVDQPQWKELTDLKDAHAFCNKVDYPVLVRPSYVLSGAAMNVVYSKADLDNYLTQAAEVSRDHPVVITKYIEEAKEIEVDAIASSGTLVMHYVSEHVENAGVHSGDATLVLPPQDLAPETISRIEVATAKIANALNVTGPLNIQFMAKNNEIKVIECNLRAARSFPFVSKVTGIDAIEIATDVMIGHPVTAYPPHTMPDNYVGVKVPQFSFSRLAGADPILGVEMASTGEVACFGKDRYEAYLKALLASGMVIPKKNVLLSIGSYKEKLEMLPSVEKLVKMGYQVFATAGTADFIEDHGLPVKYLEALREDETHGSTQKSEYSLNEHLAKNLIDLYINLPSKNRFRRPAGYMSKGYRSRRMAVDFAVPLLTNVKCAKLFIEAISRRHALEISNVDSKSSHETIVLPGLVALGVHAPNLLSKGAEKEIDALSQAAIQSGFTTLQVLPVGSSARIVDLSSKQVAASQWATARCDFVHSLVATSSNQEELQGQAPVFLPLSERTKLAGESAMTLASCLDHVSSSQTVYSDASATELASLILLASLSNVKLHVTGVSREQDLELIKLARARKVQLTCDVTVQSLLGPSAQPALLANLDTIDCLSIGAPLDGEDVFASSLSLLLKAVQQGKLTTDDVVSRMATAPAKIFGLQAGDDDTRLEVELDRSAPLHSHSSVHRVVLRGKTVSLDGSNSSDRGDGQDAAGPALVPGYAHSRRKSTRFSVSLPSKPVLSSLAPDSPLPVNTRSPVLAPVSSVPREQFQGFRLDYDAKPSVSNNRLSSFPIETAFNRRHILTVKQFSRNDLHALFSIATEMRIQVERNSAIDILRGRVLCTLFYEPSTRTSTSFEAAMIRLGGGVTSVAVDRSSVVKGESLEDTIRTIGCYGDAIVLRHPEAGAVARGAKVSNLPVINAGDGTGEHPTQAMLDVYTIREELGTVNGLTVTMVGDLKNGRTVHSLVRLLCLYQVTLVFVSPPSLSMPESVKQDAMRAGIPFTEHTNLASVIERTDVLYVTRVQQERFASAAEYETIKDSYIVNNDLLSRAKSTMAVLHPLPRNNEIDPEVDYDGRAAYFRQMKYGLFLRMALLWQIMG